MGTSPLQNQDASEEFSWLDLFVRSGLLGRTRLGLFSSLEWRLHLAFREVAAKFPIAASLEADCSFYSL
jgi:hypothetical protein